MDFFRMMFINFFFRYDKNRESANQRVKLKPVGSHVKEEFYNRFVEKQVGELVVRNGTDLVFLSF